MNTYEVAITVTDTKMFRVQAEGVKSAKFKAEVMDVENVEPIWYDYGNRQFEVHKVAVTPT